jgi:tetratricopeptide (TPR) repeat protein
LKKTFKFHSKGCSRAGSKLLGFRSVRKQRNLTADDYLRLAISTGSPAEAAVLAERGLRHYGDVSGDQAIDPETRLLLLREIYRAHLHARRLRSAHAVARKTARLGVAQEIAHVDLARACAALGWWGRAAQAYRISARTAPAARRAMHWASVAVALHHAEHYEDAMSALERAVRWSLSTRPLHRAYMALVQLDAGRRVDELESLTEVVDELECARCGEGFGRYVLGLLYAAKGERARATRHLKQFVKRNAEDPLRSITLASEIRRARRTLRELRGAKPPAPSSPSSNLPG